MIDTSEKQAMQMREKLRKNSLGNYKSGALSGLDKALGQARRGQSIGQAFYSDGAGSLGGYGGQFLNSPPEQRLGEALFLVRVQAGQPIICSARDSAAETQMLPTVKRSRGRSPMAMLPMDSATPWASESAAAE